jgi:hypothetical protein
MMTPEDSTIQMGMIIAAESFNFGFERFSLKVNNVESHRIGQLRPGQYAC